jgi:SAM-dependent methyltransferase
MTPVARRLAEKVRRYLGRALREPLRRCEKALGIDLAPMSGIYERLYEHVARTVPADVSVGVGDVDFFGRIELGVLIMEGMAPHHTLCDFGCGTGRLAMHAVPYLATGRYVGTDIAESMLTHARKRLALQDSKPNGAEVTFVKQRPDVFDVPDASVDFMCAFSVFTHMEPEDAYRYLKAARRVVRPGGKFVLACLPMHLAAAREIFVAQAEKPFEERWSDVRNFTTTTEQMETVAALAGWDVVRWYRGDEPNIRVPPDDRMLALGQSVCTLTPVAARLSSGNGSGAASSFDARCFP